MAKNKKKVQEQEQGVEHILVIEPKLGETKVEPEAVFNQKDEDAKAEATPATDKAQELMNNAVNEVLDGIISKKDLLTIAIRKVRATSVLTEEEDDALSKLHIEVRAFY